MYKVDWFNFFESLAKIKKELFPQRYLRNFKLINSRGKKCKVSSHKKG